MPGMAKYEVPLDCATSHTVLSYHQGLLCFKPIAKSSLGSSHDAVHRKPTKNTEWVRYIHFSHDILRLVLPDVPQLAHAKKSTRQESWTEVTLANSVGPISKSVR